MINSSGVADGRDLAASFALVAFAVKIGCRLLLTSECPVHECYKTAIITAKEGDTVLTGASVGDAVCGIRNNLAEKVLEIEKHCEGSR